MKTGSSDWQWVQTTRLTDEGKISNSRPQARHLKWTIEVMKPLLLMILMAVVVQAQSIADVARKERERQAKLQPARVITSVESLKAAEPKPAAPESPDTKAADGKTADAKADSAKATDAKAADAPAGQVKEAVVQAPKGPAKPPAAPPVDPVQVWNDKLSQLRTKIRGLQDQEAALLLQLNQANNQVYAPVTDPATQQRALTQVGQIQQQLAATRTELETARKTLDAMQLEGPPKK